jgi:hypothetical protein
VIEEARTIHDEIVVMPQRECFSLAQNSCRAFICASGSDPASIHSDDLATYLESPLLRNCVENGQGGTVIDQERQLSIQFK